MIDRPIGPFTELAGNRPRGERQREQRPWRHGFLRDVPDMLARRIAAKERRCAGLRQRISYDFVVWILSMPPE